MKNTFKKNIGRTLSIFLAIFLLLGTIPIVGVSAAEVTSNFEYTLLDDGTIEVTKYVGTDSYAIIPDEIDGKPVTKVNEFCFYNDDDYNGLNYTVKSIFISKNITDFSDTLNNGEYRCLNRILYLESISVDESSSVYSSDSGILFSKDFTKLIYYPTRKAGEKYIVPEYVRELGRSAFSQPANLRSLKFSSPLEKVGYAAIFNGSIEEAEYPVYPEPSSKIALFTWCEKLTKVYIGKDVKWMNDEDFTQSRNVTLYVYNNSYALDWAKEHGFAYEIMEEPTSVSLNKTSLTLDVGKSYTLTKTVSPSNAVTSYTWSSSNTSVATVDKNGKVTAKASGTATITVKTSNGKTATCKVTVNLPTPQITSLANTTGGIKISWNKVSGAYGYRLYYKPASGGWKRFKDTTATSFTDSGVVPSKTETYTIRCIDKNGNTVSGFNSTGWSKKYTPVAPTISKLDITTGGIKLSWNKIAGVYGYRLYYKPVSGGWKRFKDTTATSFTDSGVVPNKTETYTIRCIDKNGNTVSGFYSKGWSMTYTPVAPTISKLENTSGGIKISWNKIAGVYGYRLYYKTSSGGWKRFKDTTATSFTDSGVSPNRTETYTIRCIDKNGNTVSGFYSKGWSMTYTPVAPTISKLENTSGGIKISWNKIAGVYGYRLYYKPASGGWKRFKDTTATSFTESGVSPNRTETYTIRCIDKNGNTVSGFYSKGWSITRK